MLIYFEKAFDSILWSFIHKVLHFWGFGKYIIDWVKILNTNFKSSILQRGYLSEEFSIQCGCRQQEQVALIFLFLMQKYDLF